MRRAGGYKIKKGVLIVISVLFLLLAIVLASAARLPTVGGDEDSWGAVLNEFLNVSLNESGGIRPANLTFAQRVTFSLGAIIDNAVSGLVRVDSNLDVTGNVTIQGSSLRVNGKEVCLKDGTNCHGFFVNYTLTKTTGNITNGTLQGYLAANEICRIEVPGSTHMCQIHEVLSTINSNRSLSNFTATFRVSEGAPGFTANANDCAGWKSAESSALGSIWIGDTTNGGSGSLVACNALRAIGCCK